jgi:NADH-quinone oxidoreductase subunit J
VQVLIYIGAIVVLFLFGIMLTRPTIGRESGLDNDQRWLAGITGLLLFGVLSYVLVATFGDDRLPGLQGMDREALTAERGTGAVSDAIFSTYLVPFEVVSVLLLAALVGAIVLARRE